jgi:hypothetical protein
MIGIARQTVKVAAPKWNREGEFVGEPNLSALESSAGVDSRQTGLRPESCCDDGRRFVRSVIALWSS